MLDWLKRLFGIYEEVVTLAERQAKANRLAEGAIATFTGIVDDLETAALSLKEVAQAAADEAERLLEQAEAATESASKNEDRAAKIRALLD